MHSHSHIIHVQAPITVGAGSSCKQAPAYPTSRVFSAKPLQLCSLHRAGPNGRWIGHGIANGTRSSSGLADSHGSPRDPLNKWQLAALTGCRLVRYPSEIDHRWNRLCGPGQQHENGPTRASASVPIMRAGADMLIFGRSSFMSACLWR